MREKRPMTKLIQEAIDKGATTAEEIHKSIAELPLKVLEEADVLRGPAKEVRRAQDRAIGAVYELIRDVNQEVGKFASEMLSGSVGPRMRRGKAGAKKPSAVKRAAHSVSHAGHSVRHAAD